METKTDIIRKLKAAKPELQKTFQIRRIGIFGSYSRGDYREDSDIDILVELGAPLGFGFVRLAYRLEEVLGKKVDLVSKDAIKPRLWKYIAQDIVYV